MTAYRVVVKPTPIRHRTTFQKVPVDIHVTPLAEMPRAELATLIARAVAELRLVEAAFTDDRLSGSQLREEVRQHCDGAKAATGGWFDAWPWNSYFEPDGILRGYAVERAANVLRAAGLSHYAVVCAGKAAFSGSWDASIIGNDSDRPIATMTVTDCAVATSASPVHNPFTGQLTIAAPMVVMGPSLIAADAYATAQRAGGDLKHRALAAGYASATLTTTS